MSSINSVPSPRSQAADTGHPAATIDNRSGDDGETESPTTIGDVISIAGVIVVSIVMLTVVMMLIWR